MSFFLSPNISICRGSSYRSNIVKLFSAIVVYWSIAYMAPALVQCYKTFWILFDWPNLFPNFPCQRAAALYFKEPQLILDVFFSKLLPFAVTKNYILSFSLQYWTLSLFGWQKILKKNSIARCRIRTRATFPSSALKTDALDHSANRALWLETNNLHCSHSLNLSGIFLQECL